MFLPIIKALIIFTIAVLWPDLPDRIHSFFEHLRYSRKYINPIDLETADKQYTGTYRAMFSRIYLNELKKESEMYARWLDVERSGNRLIAACELLSLIDKRDKGAWDRAVDKIILSRNYLYKSIDHFLLNEKEIQEKEVNERRSAVRATEKEYEKAVKNRKEILYSADAFLLPEWKRKEVKIRRKFLMLSEKRLKKLNKITKANIYAFGMEGITNLPFTKKPDALSKALAAVDKYEKKKAREQNWLASY